MADLLREHVLPVLLPAAQDASFQHQKTSCFIGCIQKSFFEPVRHHTGSCAGPDRKLLWAISVLSIAAQLVALHPRDAAAAAAARLACLQPLSSAGQDPAPYSCSLSPSAIGPQLWGAAMFPHLPLTVHPQRSRSGSQIVSI